MTDYGLHYDKYQVISGSAYLFRSGAIADSSTAISGSTPQIIAITCSANYNNRLTKLTAINANATITITSGSSDRDNLQNDTKLIFTARSISSILIKITIIFFLFRNIPIIQIVKIISPKVK